MTIIINYKVPLLILICGSLLGVIAGTCSSNRDLRNNVINGEVVIPGKGAFICKRYLYGWELKKTED